MSAAFDILPTPDWAATTTIAISTDSSSDPGEWARAIFDVQNAPILVKALLVLREVAAKVLRIPPGEPSMLTFDRIVGNEAVIDTDDKHLHFAATVKPEPAAGLLHVVTAVKFKGVVGRVYFAPVSILHDPITRSMMKSAAERVGSKRIR
ncbi:DUF2867 domain-containing protein [Rhodococcus sp. G-MC3]|uniref:DUF2867 domain-containing protein n=1 Tax=Rhodococcus sp. G-MC3 TaxID=3046209 RepID=UPI0024B968DF|nr:DUF2867 domain-containing protein [Rhodococcus sp. G-MC3]MDJ0396095.1 DUF2867 domain-containing protein [Rhodococcus sp. G-MC3]